MRNVADFYYSQGKPMMEDVPLRQCKPLMFVEGYYNPVLNRVWATSDPWRMYTSVQDEVRRLWKE